MSAEGLNGAATASDTAYCYRVFLGREAENDAVIEEKVGRSRTEVLAAFITSGEFGSQVFYRLIDGLAPATPLHEKAMEAEAGAWAAGYFGIDESRAERLRRASSGLAVLATVATVPSFVRILEDQFGVEPTAAFGAALQARAIRTLRQTASEDVVLTLRCGTMVMGALGRMEPRPGTPQVHPDIWDFGLADFARLSRLDDFAIGTLARDGEESVFPLAVPRSSAGEPLASRRRCAPHVELADIWCASRRDLALRFAGQGEPLTLDVYQCLVGEAPVKLVAAAPIGGPIAIVTAKLLNPLMPVLLVFRDSAGTIRLFDHIPFPSLARGGLHAAERAICGNGGDDLADIAMISGELLPLLLDRADHSGRTVATIDIDPAAETGIEPAYDDDLLEYLAQHLDITAVGAAGSAMAGQLARFQPVATRDGPTLLLPAATVPSLSALIRPIPADLPPQTVTGSLGIIDWDRQGAVYSVWAPPVGQWLDDLQWRAGRRAAPMLRVGDGEGRAGLALGWPLALAIRQAPLAQINRSPFEISAETALPLLRGGDDTPPRSVDVVVLFDEKTVSPIPLLETIARQQRLGEAAVLVCRPSGRSDPTIMDALNGLFPGRGRIVGQRTSASPIEQLAAAAPDLAADYVLVVDAATLLTDPRTIATLSAILSNAQVASAGCMIRTIDGDRRIARHGGYVLSHADLRATPMLGFSPADLSLFDAPVTLPVAANSMAATLVRRAVVEALPARGADGGRPGEDDVMFGLAALASGLNLCTSVVCAHSERPAPTKQMLGVALPYRLDAQLIERLLNATAVIQRIR